MPEPAVTYTFEGQDVTLTFQGHRIIGSTLYVEETNVMTSYVCVAENRRGQAKEEVSGRFFLIYFKVYWYLQSCFPLSGTHTP